MSTFSDETSTREYATRRQPPCPSSSAASAVMRGNRGRDTRPELALRSELHRRGLRFRTHFRPVPDLPYVVDIAFPRQRVAVALDGCIWHGCPKHGMHPRVNAAYWHAKIASNVARDERTDQALADAGWKMVRVWEHEPASAAAERIEQIIASERDTGR